MTLDAQGNLYGTTSLGGTGGVGTVWEVAKGTNTVTTLASFDGVNGAGPLGGVTLDAQGNLYGSTTGGGPNGEGTVFEVVKGSNTITTLFSQGSNDLVLDAQGNLYLTGHAQIGEPVVEELSKLADGTYGISNVFAFTGIHAAELVDGLTLDAQGNLYGATEQFSLLGQGGTLWEIAKGSNTITTLATFSGKNGHARQRRGLRLVWKPLRQYQCGWGLWFRYRLGVHRRRSFECPHLELKDSTGFVPDG